MKILVYGVTRERARSKLQDLLDNFKHGDVNKVSKGYNDFVVELKNGDIYKTVTANDSSRGHKWDYAYIDNLIDVELTNNIIMPCFSYKGDLKDSYEWY